MHRRPTLFDLAFVLYCVETGLIFLLTPWGVSWDREVVRLPVDGLRLALLSPWCRAALSAFGALHLLWALHDIDSWIRSRR